MLIGFQCLICALFQGFCPEQGYLQDLPTKQNILCSRRSVLAVVRSALRPSEPEPATRPNISAKIRDPESFSVLPTPAPLPVSFHYQIPDRKRFVIVLERANTMGLNNRWSLLHGELFRFISTLPNDSEVALITYGQEAALTLSPTLLDKDNREGIYGRIPRRHLDDDSACLECALKLAMKTLSAGSEINGGGTLVLITASPAKPAGFDEVLQTVHDESHQVYTVAFEKSIFYEARALAVHGHTYIVHEKHHDVLAAAVNISDIFTAILRSAAEVPLQKFHEEQKLSDDSNIVSGTFVVEESLRDNLWVQLSSPNEDDIEMFELTSPTGEVFEFPRFEHGLVYFQLSGAQEPGIWGYRARLFKKDQYVRVALQVLAAPSHADSLELEAWTSVDHSGVNALHTPVKLFARLTSHTSPVLHAEVTATVHRPGNAEPVSVTLRDSGTGYPDITRGDGVYSAYFTQFTSEPGFYSVVVTVRNKDGAARLPRLSVSEKTNSTCCGSALPFSYTVPLTHFSRHTLSGSFFVKEGSQFYLRQGSPTRNDVFPPSRITDFKLANYLDHSLYVTLKWSAPGNDYDYGTAFRYEVRCYTNREALRNENFTDTGILVHTSLIPVPEPYGTEQRSTVGIPWPNEVFYYAIVAFDEEGNRGEVSNVVSVYAEETPPTPAPSVGFDQAILDANAYPRHESLPLTAPDQDTLIYVVSGVVSAVLVVVLIILLAALTRTRWTKQIKRSTSSQIYVKDTESSIGGTLKKVASLPDITKDNSLNSARSWQDSDSCEKASLGKSPVPSISDNQSWRYLVQNRAAGQEPVPGVHRVHSRSNPAHSTHSSLYSTDSSETTAAEFILGGPGPRISVMEDYTVYRDLSHLDTNTQDYFSFSQLPAELQGVSIVPYSPGYETMESSKRRHISLV